jgi:tRNA dimethylallyltransferase
MDRSELERWLRVLDPESAGKIDPRNVRRVIRALEVTLVTGHTMSSVRGSSPPGYDSKTIGLSCEREILYGIIDSRIDGMMSNGLLEEVISLKNQGYDEGTSAMSGLGYRQLLSYLNGEGTIDQAVERTKYETHRFARQQYNWFRLDDDTITWFDVTRPTFGEEISIAVRDWLETNN